MMTAMRFPLIWLLAMLPLVGCSYTYHGDGQFVDHGLITPSKRYVLTLPDIDLCKKQTYHFQIGRLPSDWWSANLNYPRRTMNRLETEKIRDSISAIHIEMKVVDKETGKIFHEYDGRLKDVSKGFQGNPYDAGIGDTHINWELVGEVFGLFDPKYFLFLFPYGTYSEREIVLSIVEPLTELRPHCEATLVISGGGWD
jgi:hypothetical protein